MLKLSDVDDMECMTTKEWSPLETGAIEHKIYCGDGTTGELVRINELQGKTKVVELIDMNVDAPDPPDAPPSPIPNCGP